MIRVIANSAATLTSTPGLAHGASTTIMIPLGNSAEWALAAAAFIGIIFTGFQVRGLRKDRETGNIISLSGCISDHNTSVSLQREQKDAIAILERLGCPTDVEGRNQYWATRLVHLSHIYMVWRVWELGASRPFPFIGRARVLGKRLDGWERFAKRIIAEALAEDHAKRQQGCDDPRVVAGSDLWAALGDYEPPSSEFVGWLKGLVAAKT